ncbi:MAG TPA: TlpA disulfide reductase family protein [Gemmatimonadales bacterium]|nr:TlpA disulfide reductase family protein [Gemmatimonadales bacterium]
MRFASGVVALAGALFACRPAAPDGGALLFFRRSPAARLDGLSWAPDPDSSRLIAFDRHLAPVRVLASSVIATPMAVTALGAALLVSEEDGSGVLLDTVGHELREWEGPFPASVYAAGGGALYAARSPYRVPTFSSERATAPLVNALDSTGRVTAGLGAIHVPDVTYLITATNAGAIAVDPGGAFYLGRLARDAIEKYSPGGALLWTRSRGLYPRETDPQFVPAAGKAPTLAIALATLALVVGPDGRLYALGADDSAASRLRVDVLDPATGAILATHHLARNETAVALTDAGTLLFLDADSLAARVGVSGGRTAFAPAFALPSLAGDTVRLSRFAGKVTLVNFWASWCDPCREEFPHMAELYRQFPRDQFEIAAISDDVDGAKMRGFVKAFDPPFLILVGGGQMKETYHYRGLPYSVLLDRRGRIIERLFGFGGAAEFRDLRAAIAKEIAAP